MLSAEEDMLLLVSRSDNRTWCNRSDVCVLHWVGAAFAGDGQLKSFSAVSLYHEVSGRDINVSVLHLLPGNHVPSAVQAGADARARW